MNVNNINIGDNVSFWDGKTELTGIVYVRDESPAEYPDDITYDIMGSDGVLHKKVLQNVVRIVNSSV